MFYVTTSFAHFSDKFFNFFKGWYNVFDGTLRIGILSKINLVLKKLFILQLAICQIVLIWSKVSASFHCLICRSKCVHSVNARDQKTQVFSVHTFDDE